MLALRMAQPVPAVEPCYGSGGSVPVHTVEPDGHHYANCQFCGARFVVRGRPEGAVFDVRGQFVSVPLPDHTREVHGPTPPPGVGRDGRTIGPPAELRHFPRVRYTGQYGWQGADSFPSEYIPTPPQEDATDG